jgi:hypothetical protein
MSTQHLNDEYDITFSVDRLGKAQFAVTGRVWDRRTSKPTSIEVRAEGRTISSAEQQATIAAKRKLFGSD